MQTFQMYGSKFGLGNQHELLVDTYSAVSQKPIYIPLTENTCSSSTSIAYTY